MGGFSEGNRMVSLLTISGTQLGLSIASIFLTS